jgi:hypothetical protein
MRRVRERSLVVDLCVKTVSPATGAGKAGSGGTRAPNCLRGRPRGEAMLVCPPRSYARKARTTQNNFG